MKVFMSWSGARSKAAAELLCDWTKCVIQASRPWISTRGIDRGAQWFSAINNELKDTAVGIVCLTHENKNKPWILFEAGALAKGLTTNRVCTFLVDLQPADLQDPLAQFNHTLPNKDGLWSLVTTLNSSLESNQLDERILREVFITYWPQFEQKFTALLADFPQEAVIEVRPPEMMLAEILESTRGLAYKMRALEDRINDPTGLGAMTTLWASENILSRAEALAIARDSIAQGFSHEQTLNRLKLKGAGKKLMKEMLELLMDSKLNRGNGGAHELPAQ